ncbi:hypothetical protein F4781DRAFT_440881 [Annulohypoxylon bovei var. microspora]|nr:hypothetical protein F4781DRAFT_440881 [Annulohypoxylon bovei var. microspora]
MEKDGCSLATSTAQSTRTGTRHGYQGDDKQTQISEGRQYQSQETDKSEQGDNGASSVSDDTRTESQKPIELSALLGPELPNIDIVVVVDVPKPPSMISKKRTRSWPFGRNASIRQKGIGDKKHNCPNDTPITTSDTTSNERDNQPRSSDVDSSQDKIDSDWPTYQAMLASQFDGVRIMAFTYKLPKNNTKLCIESEQKDHLEEIALTLLNKLEENRAGDHYTKVPIVFIGTGFGCLIIQKLVTIIDDQLRSTNLLFSITNMVSTIIFLGAPPPGLKQSTKWKSTPEQPKTGIVAPRLMYSPSFKTNRHGMSALMESTPVDSGELWKDFCCVVTKRELYVAWFYTAPFTKSLYVYVDCVKFIHFEPFVEEPIEILTNIFRGSQDPNYRKVVNEIKAGLLFKASFERDLEDLLKYFLGGKYDLSVMDYRKRCPLHNAASRANDTAVSLLISAAPDLASHQDYKGFTPLHLAVQEATKARPRGYNQAEFKLIIRKLVAALEERPDIDNVKSLKDHSRKLAWDYAQGHSNRWIWELKPDNVSSARTAQERLQLAANKRIKAHLVEFYITEESRGGSFHQESPLVYRLLRDAQYGIEGLFQRNMIRVEGKKLTCRWIHLPANNEKWLYDLFTELQLRDSSMRKRRHDAPPPFNAVDDTRSPSITPRDSSDTESSKMRGNKQSEKRDEFASSLRNLSANVDSTKKTAYALFMPILGFEQHQYRIKLASTMKTTNSLAQETLSMNDTTLFIRAYFNCNESPLHCRRTLDQFRYYMLDDTEERDNNQVVFKWARKRDRQHPKNPDGYPLLMVDQLWLWILPDEKTVITSFPNTWDSSACVDFLRREGPMDVSLKECFQSSISDIAEKQACHFEEFKSLVKDLNNNDLVAMMDIQDELRTIKDVFIMQKEVLEKFHHLINEGRKRRSGADLSEPSVDFDSTSTNLTLVNSNITAVEEMASYAEKVVTELNRLLNLKQKQANAWEARFAREGSEHAERQGNITMVFTIVTIFFLPLSFMSSVFAIQVDVYPRDEKGVSWPIQQVMGLLFGVSCAIIIPLITVAFKVNRISGLFAHVMNHIWPFERQSMDNHMGKRNNDSDLESDDDSLKGPIITDSGDILFMEKPLEQPNTAKAISSQLFARNWDLVGRWAQRIAGRPDEGDQDEKNEALKSSEVSSSRGTGDISNEHAQGTPSATLAPGLSKRQGSREPDLESGVSPSSLGQSVA